MSPAVSNQTVPKLSVVINVKNMERNIRTCLESVQFADDIVVVDMGSTDKTLSVVKKFTDRIFTHPDAGYVEPARNFAISKAKNPWVLVLDADESISPSLQTKIQEILFEPQADLYWLPRQNYVFGRWLNLAGWWPDHQPRLFKKGAVTWAPEVHSLPAVTGEQLRLSPKPEWAIVHQNYESIEQFIQKLNNYTTIQATEQFTANPQAGLTASQQTSVLKAYFDEFLKRWLALKGIDGGLHGTAAALLQANYELVKQLKLWQAAGFPPTQDDQAEAVQAVRQFQRDLNYWLADWQMGRTHGLAKFYWKVRRHFKR